MKNEMSEMKLSAEGQRWENDLLWIERRNRTEEWKGNVETATRTKRIEKRKGRRLAKRAVQQAQRQQQLACVAYLAALQYCPL